MATMLRIPGVSTPVMCSSPGIFSRIHGGRSSSSYDSSLSTISCNPLLTPASASSSSLNPSPKSGRRRRFQIIACLPPPKSSFNPTTKLFVSGLSFHTTEESLRNAFQKFGQLVEVNLVMDRIANRPRGFAFLRYATEVESKKAIEAMHGKFLDGRVIFVEVAKPRSELRQGLKQNTRQ